MDFWAPWCEPCKALDEVFALLAADNRHAKFLRVRPRMSPRSQQRNSFAPAYILLVRAKCCWPQRLKQSMFNILQ